MACIDEFRTCMQRARSLPGRQRLEAMKECRENYQICLQNEKTDTDKKDNNNTDKKNKRAECRRKCMPYLRRGRRDL